MRAIPLLLVISYIGLVLIISEYSKTAGGAMIILLVLLMMRKQEFI